MQKTRWGRFTVPTGAFTVPSIERWRNLKVRTSPRDKEAQLPATYVLLIHGTGLIITIVLQLNGKICSHHYASNVRADIRPESYAAFRTHRTQRKLARHVMKTTSIYIEPTHTQIGPAVPIRALHSPAWPIPIRLLV